MLPVYQNTEVDIIDGDEDHNEGSPPKVPNTHVAEFLFNEGGPTLTPPV